MCMYIYTYMCMCIYMHVCSCDDLSFCRVCHLLDTCCHSCRVVVFVIFLLTLVVVYNDGKVYNGNKWQSPTRKTLPNKISHALLFHNPQFPFFSSMFFFFGSSFHPSTNHVLSIWSRKGGSAKKLRVKKLVMVLVLVLQKCWEMMIAPWI